MKQTEEYRLLMDEIVREKPDLGKVRKAARRLGFRANGDLLEIMAEVLHVMSEKPTSRKKSTEVDL